jgi:hypothetical protein
MGEERKDAINATRTALYNYEVAPIIKDKAHAGVIPPKLQPDFMTKKLLPHQQAGLNRVPFGQRQQTYEDGSVHDVEKALTHLGEQLIGFFVEAPLDWGLSTKISGDPTKDSAPGVDVAKTETKTGSGKNQALG